MWRFLIVIAFAIATGAPVGAQQTPPVSVQIWQNDTLAIYDCWPAGEDNPANNEKMIVYINYQAGLAAYACEVSDIFDVLPAPARPMSEYRLASNR